MDPFPGHADPGVFRVYDACIVIRRLWVRFLPESACDIFFFTAAQTCTEHSVFILCSD